MLNVVAVVLLAWWYSSTWLSLNRTTVHRPHAAPCRTGFLGRAQDISDRFAAAGTEPDWLTIMRKVFSECFPGEEIPNVADLETTRQVCSGAFSVKMPLLGTSRGDAIVCR